LEELRQFVTAKGKQPNESTESGEAVYDAKAAEAVSG